MKKNCALLSSILFVLVSCQKIEKQPKPKDLIPEDTMAKVLVDMLKISGAKSYSSIQFRSREVRGKELIYQKYRIDSARFSKSSAYYAEHFKINERIYDTVRSHLRRQERMLDTLIERKEESDKEKRLREAQEKLNGQRGKQDSSASKSQKDSVRKIGIFTNDH